MTNVSVFRGAALWLSLLACCGPARDEQRQGRVETCTSGVRNEQWDIDCSAACQHVAACRVSYGDSDIEQLTCDDCLGSCVAGAQLGGNDLEEGSEEDRTSWKCAALVEGCSALDHNCDLF